MTVRTATYSSPALCGKGPLWDTLKSSSRLAKRKSEENSVAALPFAQEWLLSWGCHAWPLAWAIVSLPCTCLCLCLARYPTEPDPDYLASLTWELPHVRDLAWWSLDSGWPGLLCSWLHLRPVSSTLTNLTSSLNLAWSLLLTSFLSPDLPCLCPEGWGPDWQVPGSARLVSTLRVQPSLDEADSDAGTESTDRIPTK